MRIQQLENQLRQLTGQNEELQYRNRQLEERLRQLQGGAQARLRSAQPSVGRASPVQSPPAAAAAPGLWPAAAGYRQPQPATSAADRRAGADRSGAAGGAAGAGRRRGDAFDPSQNPNAPGAPRALGGGQLPIPAEAPVGAPGGRGAGEPLDLANYRRAQSGGGCRRRRRAAQRAPAALDHPAAVGDAEGRVRSRHRLHAAQGLCAGRRDHAQLRAEISERSADRRIRNTGSARASSSASNIATPPKPSSP